MKLSGWRASLRIARREAWRAKGRSTLVIALIGLPVLVLAIADICYRTWQLDTSEKLDRTLGAADASVVWVGGKAQQDPTNEYGSAVGIHENAPVPPLSALVARFPAGARAIEWRQNFGSISTEAGLKGAEIVGLDYADPIAHGLVSQLSGRAPRSAGEIAFTSTLAHDSGLQVGDTVHTTDPNATFRLVGIVADASSRNAVSAYTLPAAIPPYNHERVATNSRWLVDEPGPVTWQQVLRLNDAGYTVLSRHVVLHPPPESQVPYELPPSPPVSSKAIATGTLIVGMALLEVVLLAGPAFAVSARRQRRDLALIAAVGGRRRDLRNVVFSKGIVLGVAAGVIAVVAGIALAAIGIATLGRYVSAIPGHLDIRPLELSALTLVSLLTALAAAVFPARGAARTDVVAALAGRRGTARTRKRVAVAGAAIAGAGVAVALGAVGASANATVILVGVALTEVGLIVCTPALLGLISRAGRWLPLSPRIALRDAGRNRSSAAPAVAAVMAAVIGSVALVIGVASSNDQDRRTYDPSLPMNDAFVYLEGTHVRADDVVAALRDTLPVRRVVTVDAPDQSCRGGACPATGIGVALPRGRSTVEGYAGGDLPKSVIDDGSGAESILGMRAPDAMAALRRGAAVVTDPSLVRDGTVALDVITSGRSRQATVPAVAVDPDQAFVQLIVPPALAMRLGVTWIHYGVLADTTRRPSEREQQAAAGALAKIAPDLPLDVETGFHSDILWALLGLIAAAGAITIGAALIATALSNVDGRTDLMTLGAVGAAPRTRRMLSLSRAGVIAGIGTVLGTAAGLVPSYAWTSSVRTPDLRGVEGAGDGLAPMRFVVPWLPLVATLIVVPVLAMLVAGLFTRARLPSERPSE